MRSPEFWQRWLGAELAPAKNRVLLEELGSFTSDPFDFLVAHPALNDKERQRVRAVEMAPLEAAVQDGAKILEQEAYPESLLEGGNIPPALFVNGDAECLYGPVVGIVGTRSASTYGKACAFKFAQALAAAGVTVISGGALGIDGAAHKGALDAGGKTAAVLGSGIDGAYPAVHRGLFRQIAQSGCLISQFAAGARMADYKFLVRNQLVAALSQAVVVVEAPARSGAISTAMAANELGREVFVVPANIDYFGFQGSFALLRDGATMVTHPQEVLQFLQITPREPAMLSEASPAGVLILNVLTSDPITAELIVERSGLETAEVLSELTMLELEGRIIRGQGGYALIP